MRHMRLYVFGRFAIQSIGDVLDRVPIAIHSGCDDFLGGFIEGLAFRDTVLGTLVAL